MSCCRALSSGGGFRAHPARLSGCLLVLDSVLWLGSGLMAWLACLDDWLGCWFKACAWEEARA